jgi:threonine/homoserine/homoserine lactone efflux protein
MFIALLIGFVFGFVGSMPVAGPVSILVFGRGLQDRQRSAVYLAAGSALAESVYAYFAFWGFGALLALHPWLEPITRGAAAVILTALGLHFALKRAKDPGVETGVAPSQSGNKRNFLLGITITALNPTLMATWGAAVTTLHSFDIVTFEASRALPFSLGVFLGITGWFTVLLWLLTRFKGRFERSTLDRTVRAMGWALAALGLFFAVRFVSYFHGQMQPASATRSITHVGGDASSSHLTARLDHDFDAPVLGPPVAAVVVRERPVGADPNGVDRFGRHAARDQEVDHDLRALRRQLHVGGAATARVGVAFDHDVVLLRLRRERAGDQGQLLLGDRGERAFS